MIFLYKKPKIFFQKNCKLLVIWQVVCHPIYQYTNTFSYHPTPQQKFLSSPPIKKKKQLTSQIIRIKLHNLATYKKTKSSPNNIGLHQTLGALSGLAGSRKSFRGHPIFHLSKFAVAAIFKTFSSRFQSLVSWKHLVPSLCRKKIRQVDKQSFIPQRYFLVYDKANNYLTIYFTDKTFYAINIYYENLYIF